MNAPITRLKLWEGSPTLASAPTSKNFLFLSGSSPCDAGTAQNAVEKFITTARSMAKEGYVYLADLVQKEVRDDEFGVRHLPLKEELPAFGDLCAVVVLEDEQLLQRAHRQYPEAVAFLFSASPATSSRTAKTFNAAA